MAFWRGQECFRGSEKFSSDCVGEGQQYFRPKEAKLNG